MATHQKFAEPISIFGEAARPARETKAPTRFLARQPILDLNQSLYGYELLFRDGAASVFSGDPDDATCQVIDNYLLLIPEGSQIQAFVNCTRETLVTGMVTLLPPQTTVLEILEDIDPDDELLASCRELRKKGYRFALDDFRPDESKRPFLPIADFIKVDFRLSDEGERQAIRAMAASCGARLLAEKVETGEDVAIARAEGCQFFQGFFFSRPSVISPYAVASNHLIYLRLLAALSQSPPRINEIERIVLSDTLLCYRILRLVNSSLYYLSSTVGTIRNALLLIGEGEMRKLVTIALAGAYADRQPRALALMALERAKFCELLAPLLRRDPNELYLLGMLSLIDVVMQTPMAVILDALPLSLEMKDALGGELGVLGQALDFIRRYESGDWIGCEAWGTNLGLTEQQAASFYVEAVRWAAKVMPHEDRRKRPR